MSVEKTPTGRWKVRWRDETKRARSRTFDRRSDAEEWEGEVRRLRQRGRLGTLDSGKITLSAYIQQTMDPEVFSRRALRTQTFYADLLAAHILPDLGLMPLAELTAKRLRRWQSDRLDDGAGRYALNRALALLSQILQHAAEDGELDANAATLVRKVDEEPGEPVRPMPPTEVEKIRIRLDLRDRTLVSLLAYAGLRPQEAYALRWQEIGENTIHVHRAVDGYGGTKTTKTKATRAVRILAVLREDLAEWRAANPDARDRSLLFPVATSSRIASKTIMDNWRSTTWTWALARAGIDYQRPYDLRHSFASLLLAEGRTIHVVAQQLGHDAKMTMSTYGHIFAEFEDAVRVDAEERIRTARAETDGADAPLPSGRARWPFAVLPPEGRGARGGRRLHVAATDDDHPLGLTACNRTVGAGWRPLPARHFVQRRDGAGDHVHRCTTCERRRDEAAANPAVARPQSARGDRPHDPTETVR
jgi:integrase